MLEVRNISYGTAGKEILREISFVARPGKFLGILGPNGAGKSTLLKLLSRELKMQHGHVLFNGIGLNVFSITDMAKARAVMTQNISMSGHFNVHEVVMMGRYPYFKSVPQPADADAVQRALVMAGLQDFEHRTYHSLSGGEQQRVQFARVLAQMDSPQVKPKMLLLDEPLNNLDIKYQHQLLETAVDFSRKGNVVMAVLHDINLSALYADELLLLHRGKLKAMGSPHEVINEKILETCYDFPVRVTEHPYHPSPVVYFVNPAKTNLNINENHLNYDTQIKC